MTELRDELEKAFESEEANAPEQPAPEPAPAPEAEMPAVEEPVAERSEEPAEVAQEQKDAPEAQATTPEVAEAPKEQPKPQLKAPVGWTPEAREGWDQLPEPVKQQVAAREQHMAQVMHNTSEARRTYDAMNQLTNQYGAVMAAEGAQNPIQALSGLLQTVTELRMGSPAQKAQKVAQLISHYGIDIQTLDAALAGEPVQDSTEAKMAQMMDQKLAPVNEMMGQLGQMQLSKQQMGQEQANQEVEAFAQQAEFINDVRYEMADLMDVAQRQGRQLSLQEAYNKACAMNPHVSNVILQRIEAQKAQVAKKQVAASSVRGSGQMSTSSVDLSLADEIRSAWDSLS